MELCTFQSTNHQTEEFSCLKDFSNLSIIRPGLSIYDFLNWLYTGQNVTTISTGVKPVLIIVTILIIILKSGKLSYGNLNLAFCLMANYVLANCNMAV